MACMSRAENGSFSRAACWISSGPVRTTQVTLSAAPPRESGTSHTGINAMREWCKAKMPIRRHPGHLDINAAVEKIVNSELQ